MGGVNLKNTFSHQNKQKIPCRSPTETRVGQQTYVFFCCAAGVSAQRQARDASSEEFMLNEHASSHDLLRQNGSSVGLTRKPALFLLAV